MRITAEISLYPLHDGYLDKIVTVVRRLRERPGLEVAVNQMSSQIRGELADVMAAIEDAVSVSFAEGRPEVLVAKIVNADLPISEAPIV